MLVNFHLPEEELRPGHRCDGGCLSNYLSSQTPEAFEAFLEGSTFPALIKNLGPKDFGLSDLEADFPEYKEKIINAFIVHIPNLLRIVGIEGHESENNMRNLVKAWFDLLEYAPAKTELVLASLEIALSCDEFLCFFVEYGASNDFVPDTSTGSHQYLKAMALVLESLFRNETLEVEKKQNMIYKAFDLAAGKHYDYTLNDEIPQTLIDHIATIVMLDLSWVADVDSLLILKSFSEKCSEPFELSCFFDLERL